MAGVFLAGWDSATALSLYWWENLIGSLLVLLRLLAHKRLTRKRGYERLHLTLASRDGQGTEARWKKGRPAPQERPGSFLGEFALSALAATAVHGLLLWVLIVKVVAHGADGRALRQGVLGVAAFQLAAFLFDLRGLRQRSFAWARELAQNTLNRVTLIHLALIVGAWMALTRNGVSFFGPFAVIKALADGGNLLARAGVRVDGDEVPAWLAATMNRLGPKGADFGEYWHLLKAEQHRLEAQDEQSRQPTRRRKRR